MAIVKEYSKAYSGVFGEIPYYAIINPENNALYEKYGWFKEKTINLVMPGLDGLQKMQNLMSSLRSDPPTDIAGEKVIRLRDYSNGSIWVAGLGVVDKTPFAGSNVLYFELADGCSFIIRPSGTEPKIKIYILKLLHWFKSRTKISHTENQNRK